MYEIKNIIVSKIDNIKYYFKFIRIFKIISLYIFIINNIHI